MKKKYCRIEFVGGPVCGLVSRFDRNELDNYIGLVCKNREYLYRFAYRHFTDSNSRMTIRRRYIFQGHDAEVPEEYRHDGE